MSISLHNYISTMFPRLLLFVSILLFSECNFAQNYTFNFNTTGRRVCLVSSEVGESLDFVKILFLDSLSNTSESMDVYRRTLGSYTWTAVANNLPAGTGHWIDSDVNAGETWEYQVKRENTWNFQSVMYDATGYTMACLQSDNVQYKGQMILLVADNIAEELAVKMHRLKKEITSDGWFINEIIVPKATSWDSGEEVVDIKNQISTVYQNAPENDKPVVLFIIGHVPMPRCGSTDVTAPDAHDQNKGARGCDSFYADIDGIFTDNETFNPAGLSTPFAINLPNDYKWDQDFFPSDIEMAFGRIDFADLTETTLTEIQMMESYFDRLSAYKNVDPGYEMGEKTAFYNGYDNSNDGSFRSLPNISLPENFYQNYTGPNHNEWVQNNGPFKIYMQNVSAPNISDWENFGMNATVYSSDQSYWGFGDVPQPGGVYSRIRTLLGLNSKCLIALWTTSGINIFHQACTGEPLGVSMKTIMNHNATNQYLEKAPQQYDTQEWWNRTHLTLWGDPTLTLYQVKPATNLSISNINEQAVMEWTPSDDSNVVGYHIFESESEFGKFTRISSSIISDNVFTIPNYAQGKWYMVKAVSSVTSGCGQFYHGSLGNSIQGTFILNVGVTDFTKPAYSVYPNPSSGMITITSIQPMSSIIITNAIGERIIEISVNTTTANIDLSRLEAGIYMIQAVDQFGHQHQNMRFTKL